MQCFSNRTLNCIVFATIEQIFRKLIREKEPDLSCLNSTGIPKPLGAISRVPKQDTEAIIPDDGFRELKTTYMTVMQNPKVHRCKEKPIMRMINKYNIAELSLVDRPVGGTLTGFGSVINRYPQQHDQRNFNSTNHDFFGKPHVDSAQKVIQEFQRTYNIHAGGHVRPFEDQSVKQISNLTGEVYSKDYDPQAQTDVQRAWMYSQDPGVRAVNQGLGGKKSVMQPYDNANSLCLGDGMQSDHPQANEPGRYRRISQDVTRYKNKVITRK